MKRNRKGFTLVELLAVIVILALLIVITANTILPMMNKTKKNAMVVYASKVLEQASANYVIDSMMNGGQPKVYSIENMMGGNTKYYGAVKVSTTSEGKYSYDINMFEDDEQLGLISTNLSSSEIKANTDDIISTENYLEKITAFGRSKDYYIDDLQKYVFDSKHKDNFIKTWEVLINAIRVADGAETAAAGWRRTDYLKVSQNEKFYFKLNDDVNNDLSGVAFYNSSKKFIKGFGLKTIKENSGEFTVPSDASYMRVSWATWNICSSYGEDYMWEDCFIFKKIS